MVSWLVNLESSTFFFHSLKNTKVFKNSRGKVLQLKLFHIFLSIVDAFLTSGVFFLAFPFAELFSFDLMASMP